jgi:hypothetical protein
MAEITVYRDTPKPGETDARWCAYVAANGHVQSGTTGHATPGEAAAAVGADEAEQDTWNTRFPHHG